MQFCFLVQNFAEIAQSVDELWSKSDFQDGGRRHLKFQKLKFLVTRLLSGSISAVVWQISSKSDDFLTEIWRSNDFQNGGRPPSWILKFAFLVTWFLSACSFASWYKMSLKSDNRSMNYGYKSDFQYGGGCHLEFLKIHFWSRGRYRVRYLL